MKDLVRLDPSLLTLWNQPVPRYTSYPTAPQFAPCSADMAAERLSQFDAKNKPLSIYVHIPFCKTMCLFCGCSVVLNRSLERQENYFACLLREISLTAQGQRCTVSQLHLGGGTPTMLEEEQLERLMSHFHRHFAFLPTAEISIEIDPRTVYADRGKKLSLLKELGFNRVSFGVQDLDPLVQEAVRRRQSEEMTVFAYEKARELAFSGINIDLIYGLPHQTVPRFVTTVSRIIDLKPDRIALYSYAKVPWLKPHQKAIAEETLPSTEEKFQIYVEARERFMQAGFTAIGMDHFALAEDPLSLAYRDKKLTRNFQGYSVEMAEDMLGFGLTAIGYLEHAYLQNTKDLSTYLERLSQGHLPLERGLILTEEDLVRKQVISSLMCHFEVEKHLCPPADLASLQEEGLLLETPTHFIATPLGRLFIRLIAARFDAYLHRGTFSRAV